MMTNLSLSTVAALCDIYLLFIKNNNNDYKPLEGDQSIWLKELIYTRTFICHVDETRSQLMSTSGKCGRNIKQFSVSL